MEKEIVNLFTFNLCGNKCCPVVTGTKQGVEIGEEGNLVKLKPEEWNKLVESIKSGELDKIVK